MLNSGACSCIHPTSVVRAFQTYSHRRCLRKEPDAHCLPPECNSRVLSYNAGYSHDTIAEGKCSRKSKCLRNNSRRSNVESRREMKRAVVWADTGLTLFEAPTASLQQAMWPMERVALRLRRHPKLAARTCERLLRHRKTSILAVAPHALVGNVTRLRMTMTCGVR